jgi:hypothetical protein
MHFLVFGTRITPALVSPSISRNRHISETFFVAGMETNDEDF